MKQPALSRRGTAVALLAAATLAAAAHADVTIGSLDTTGFSPSSGHRLLAQTFAVPAGESGIASASLVLHNEGSPIQGQFSVFSYDSGTLTLTPLYTTPFLLPNGAQQTLDFFPLLSVNPGTTYAVGIDWGHDTNQGGYYNSTYYSGGYALFQADGNPIAELTGLDLAFQVHFAPVPAPASLSLAAVSSFCLLRRRR